MAKSKATKTSRSSKTKASTTSKSANKKTSTRSTKKKTVKKATKSPGKSVKKKATLKKSSKPSVTKKVTKKKSTTKKKQTAKSTSLAQSKLRNAIDEESLPVKPLSISQLRKIKSGLTKQDIASYKELLLKKRAEIIGDVQAMQNDACNKNADGNLSHMPVHMADIGSDNYEQEFTLGLVESERRLLHEIVCAIERIADRIYGVCEETGVPIGKPRLDAKPWARYCIEVAREHERRGIT